MDKLIKPKAIPVLLFVIVYHVPILLLFESDLSASEIASVYLGLIVLGTLIVAFSDRVKGMFFYASSDFSLIKRKALSLVLSYAMGGSFLVLLDLILD